MVSHDGYMLCVKGDAGQEEQSDKLGENRKPLGFWGECERRQAR